MLEQRRRAEEWWSQPRHSLSPMHYRDWSVTWARGRGGGGSQKPAQYRSILDSLWLASEWLQPHRGLGVARKPCRELTDILLYLEILRECLSQVCPQMV